MLMVADLPPADTGLKATDSMQMEFGASVEPQPLVSSKSSAWPVSVIELTVRLAPPVFLTVTVCGADAVPMA